MLVFCYRCTGLFMVLLQFTGKFRLYEAIIAQTSVEYAELVADVLQMNVSIGDEVPYGHMVYCHGHDCSFCSVGFIGCDELYTDWRYCVHYMAKIMWTLDVHFVPYVVLYQVSSTQLYRMSGKLQFPLTGTKRTKPVPA